MTKRLQRNVALELQRNAERYTFLRWCQHAFQRFRLVPPATGICHQVNLEYLAKTVWVEEQAGRCIAYPDTVVGTDSHTTMINGLGVLGWGVGGIEAEAAMLGEPLSMSIPEVVGVRLVGQLAAGVTATDLVLTLTEQLRQLGVVAKFVEYIGPGLSALSVADRATIANMAPEYGATCGFFPIDVATIDYLRLTGRDERTIALVEAYAKQQGMWYDEHAPEPCYSATLTVDLATITPSIAGPKRPQDRVPLAAVPARFTQYLAKQLAVSTRHADSEQQSTKPPVCAVAERGDKPQRESVRALRDGDIVIAAITSCTNTSNPVALLTAGWVAKKAIQRGLTVPAWVKTSFAPGSTVVTEYLLAADLQPCLDQLGFNLVGYGCTTCIGNSGPLSQEVAHAVADNHLLVCAVLSGNRNFEGRIHPAVKANWLASPPLVVAYALVGTIQIDLQREAIGYDPAGQPVYLHDLWPTPAELQETKACITRDLFTRSYAGVFDGSAAWQHLPLNDQPTYTWQAESTYIQRPPFFAGMALTPRAAQDVQGARILAILGDSITTDHISPAGMIPVHSPAGRYLRERGVTVQDFNSYGARRGNHEVMMRGTFANIRIRNAMVPEQEGGVTRHYPSQDIMSIYDAAMRYREAQVPLVVIAGKEYGTGSSRDWAAKGPCLLGVIAIVAESYERIHRTNLIGMGILPLQFLAETRNDLQLTGEETLSLALRDQVAVKSPIMMTIHYVDGREVQVKLLCCIETKQELIYYQHGGILPYLLIKRQRTEARELKTD